MDLSTLTGAVAVTTVSAAIMAVGAILIGPDLVMYAVRKVRSMVKRG